MKQYKDLDNTVLNEGIRKNNRTGVDTIMYFGYHYKVDLAAGFPLLTTKKIFFNSVISCLLYTSPSPRDRTRSRMPSSA